MKWVYNDGGRSAAGYKGTAGDCVCKAWKESSELPNSIQVGVNHRTNF